MPKPYHVEYYSGELSGKPFVTIKPNILNGPHVEVCFYMTPQEAEELGQELLNAAKRNRS